MSGAKNAAAPAAGASAGPPTTICQAALDLIVAGEVTSPQFYAARLTRPTWPGGESGVTIGIGRDLGQSSVVRFREDWGGRLASGAVNRLAQACGVRGAKAEPMARELGGIEIPWYVAYAAFAQVDIPRAAFDAFNAFPNCAALAEASFGALVSLVFNRGTAMTDPQGDDRHSRLEMRAIRDLMAQRRFAEVPAQLRAMVRLWPEMEGLRDRRIAEAALFEAGLSA